MNAKAEGMEKKGMKSGDTRVTKDLALGSGRRGKWQK